MIKHDRPAKYRRWIFPKLAVIAALIVLIGTSLALYPSMANWFSEVQQQRVLDLLQAEQPMPALTVSPRPVAKQILEAREYNKLLVGGVIIEANTNKPTGELKSEGGFDYNKLLVAGDDGIMGRLTIPSINVDLPIYHGTSDEVLAKGVGHLRGTSLPVGGKSQRTVLTAHRGLPEAVLFTNLNKVKKGDRFSIDVFGEVLTYQVFDIKVIDPEDTDAIRVEPGKDLATLITCTPLGINTQRIVVTGERVVPTPQSVYEAMAKQPQVLTFPWWIVIFCAVLTCAIGYVYFEGRRLAKRARPRRAL